MARNNLKDSQSFWEEFQKILKCLEKNEPMVQYLEKWAVIHNIDYLKDTCGNIIMKVPATNGMEKRQTIILQANVGMVHENKFHDEGLDYDYSNSIGIPLTLAIISDPKVKHGPLECIFTIEKENGLTGASELNTNNLIGRTFLNLDGNCECIIYNSSAGGMDTIAKLWYNMEPAPEDSTAYSITLNTSTKGLVYERIKKNDINSIKMLAEILLGTKVFNSALCDFQGGEQHEVIANKATTVVFIPNNHINDFLQYMKVMKSNFEKEYHTSLNIITEKANVQPEAIIDKKTQSNLLNGIIACPHGIIAMSEDNEVKTSTDISVCQKKEGYFLIVTSQRSSTEWSKQRISNKVRSVFELAGAKVEQSNEYPAWSPDEVTSDLLEFAEHHGCTDYDSGPAIENSHGRIRECGIFKNKIPELQIISLGTTLNGIPHKDDFSQPRAVNRCFNLVCKILEFYNQTK